MIRTLHFLLSLSCLLNVVATHAQQDPMYTKYMFNKLTFNPACAGSNEHLVFNLVHRKQWTGLDGAPVSQAFSAHTPLKNEHLGVGFTVNHDKIGPTGTLDFNAAYAYRMPVGEHLRLSLGLQAGLTNWFTNWSDIRIQHSDDPVYQENYSRWLPNFGGGAYLTGDQFYVGLACPRMLEHNLRQVDDATMPLFAKNYRHYYTTVGAAFPLASGNVVFRPSALLKSTGWFSAFRKNSTAQRLGSPTALDLDVSFFFIETFWVGAAYRTALERGISSDDSADLWVAWYLRNGLRFGLSYDIITSQLRKVSGGSYELMLGYEFDIKVKQVSSVRYF